MSEYFDEEKQVFKFKTESEITSEDLILYYMKDTYPMYGEIDEIDKKELTKDLIESHKRLKNLNSIRVNYMRLIPEWKRWMIRKIFGVEV